MYRDIINDNKVIQEEQRKYNKDDKKEIKVAVLTTKNNFVGNDLAFPVYVSISKKIYKGFNIDIFNIIKKKLSNKYKFKVIYLKDKSFDYNGLVEDVYKGKYDLIIGGFFLSSWRDSKINFTLPLYLNSNSILHLRETKNIKNIINLIFKILQPIFFLIVLGIIFGIILYFVEPKRGKYNPHVKNNFGRLKRSILTTISSFYGEMGFLTENSPLSIFGIILVICIIIIATIILQITQARLTTLNISLENDKSKIEVDQLYKTTILALKGDSAGEKIKKLGAKLHIVDNKSYDEMVDFYEKNKNKFQGIAMAYSEAFHFLKKDKNLMITSDNMGMEPVCWIVNKKRKQLLEDLDNHILMLREEGTVSTLCKEYITFKGFCLI